jgi:hypothetical protein
MKTTVALLILLGSTVAKANIVQVVVNGTNYTYLCDRNGCSDTSVDVDTEQGRKEMADRMSVAFAPLDYDACGHDRWCAEARAVTLAQKAKAAETAKAMAEAKAKRHARKAAK